MRNAFVLQNKVAHSPLGHAEAMSACFFESSLVFPTIVCNSVTGDDRPGAILASLAVDKHGPVLGIVK
jgi:hypothetical protein